jgi:TetR/AcrR family mexXY operon transcriptional repressor
MARKTKEDTLKTVVSILDAAEDVFVKKGVAHSTIADIAKRAGVSKGAVYGHYKDKLAICVAVCERGIRVMDDLPVGSDQQTQLERWFEWGMGYFKLMTDSKSVRNVMEIIYCKCEQSPEYEPIQNIRSEWEKKSWKITSGLLKRAAKEGEIAADSDIDLCNFYLHSLLEGMVMTLLYTQKSKPVSRTKIGTLLAAGIRSITSAKGLR